MANAFLNANGMSTSDAMVESVTQISRGAGAKGGLKFDSRIPFQKRVNYRRLFYVNQTEYPSVGPGGKMIVLFDDSSDVQMFMRIWRPVTQQTSQVLNDAALSIADFHTLGTKALIGDSKMPPCNTINIDNVSLGYYEDDFVTPQTTILPVYVLDCTCEDDTGTFGTQVYLPALHAPMGVTITHPNEEERVVDYGQDVTFDCEVTGGKAPYTYQWSSDKDGVLGAAKTIVTNALTVNQRDLEPTMHVVTVTVTDADGWKSSSQVQVMVNPKSVSQAKLLTNGDRVALLGDVVTVSQPSYFYVENSQRTTGIKVISAAQPGVNGAVAVHGTAGTDHNQRCVNATSVQVVKSADAILPFATCIRSIGGGASGTPPQGQVGVTEGMGLNTIGLLMRAGGTVTARYAGESPQRFLLDDGSPRKLNCLCLSGVTLPAVNDVCIVTGVSSIGFATSWDLSASMIVTDCRKVN